MPPLAENSGSAVVAAVIGLGSMGLGMAQSMKRAGLDVVGYDITPKRRWTASSPTVDVARQPLPLRQRTPTSSSPWSSTARRPRRCCSGPKVSHVR